MASHPQYSTTPSNVPLDPNSTTHASMKVKNNADPVQSAYHPEFVTMQPQQSQQLLEHRQLQQQLSNQQQQQHFALSSFQPSHLYIKRDQRLDPIQLPRQQSLPSSLEQHSPLDRYPDPSRDGHKEVKQRLQEFVLSKQQSVSSGSTPPTPTIGEQSQQNIFSPAQEIERESREANAKRPTQGERELTKRALRDNTFPLRKTMSEPDVQNMKTKIRRKQQLTSSSRKTPIGSPVVTRRKRFSSGRHHSNSVEDYESRRLYQSFDEDTRSGTSSPLCESSSSHTGSKESLHNFAPIAQDKTNFGDSLSNASAMPLPSSSMAFATTLSQPQFGVGYTFPISSMHPSPMFVSPSNMGGNINFADSPQAVHAQHARFSFPVDATGLPPGHNALFNYPSTQMIDLRNVMNDGLARPYLPTNVPVSVPTSETQPSQSYPMPNYIMANDQALKQQMQYLQTSQQMMVQTQQQQMFYMEMQRQHQEALAKAASANQIQDKEHMPNVAYIPTIPLGGIAGQVFTGVAYDNVMLKHMCKCENPTIHRECGGRLQSIWARLREVGILRICERIKTRKASAQELQTVHSEKYVSSFLDKMQASTKPDNGEQEVDVTDISVSDLNLIRLPCGGMGIDSETVWDPYHTPKAARTAVGCVIDLAAKVARGELKNGMAIVRPPGHHAGRDTAIGSCYFNSVAIAATILKQKFNVHKILIFDWDIHHGNGTQNTFYEDPNVLTISIHRYDKGSFFPGTGSDTEVGSGPGTGYNVNIAWNGGLEATMGDPEYLAAFRCVILPIAKMFRPEVILISAGFNAVAGQAHGNFGYKVSPACFAYMTRKLMDTVNSKIVLALEGGHDLPAICDASECCMRALLSSEPMPLISGEERAKEPNHVAVTTLEKVINLQQENWPQIKRMMSYIKYSQDEAERHEKEEVDTISALAALSMGVTSGFTPNSN